MAFAHSIIGDGGTGVVIDVGANRGQSAEKLRRAFPAATIIAFEPALEQFLALAEACAPIGVIAVPKAVGASDGEVRFNVDEQDFNHSIQDRSATLTPFVSVRHSREVTARIVTLDTFCAENGHDHVIFLKVDAEGADLQVLRGACGLLSRQAINLVYVEALAVDIFAGQGWLDEILLEMRRRDYALMGMFDGRRAPDGRLMLTNCLFASLRALERSAPSLPQRDAKGALA